MCVSTVSAGDYVVLVVVCAVELLVLVSVCLAICVPSVIVVVVFDVVFFFEEVLFVLPGTLLVCMRLWSCDCDALSLAEVCLHGLIVAAAVVGHGGLRPGVDKSSRRSAGSWDPLGVGYALEIRVAE